MGGFSPAVSLLRDLPAGLHDSLSKIWCFCAHEWDYFCVFLVVRQTQNPRSLYGIRCWNRLVWFQVVGFLVWRRAERRTAPGVSRFVPYR